MKVGDEYKTKSEDNFHGKTTFIIAKLTGQSKDDTATLKATKPIRYKRGYKNFTARVLWLQKDCIKVTQ